MNATSCSFLSRSFLDELVSPTVFANARRRQSRLLHWRCGIADDADRATATSNSRLPHSQTPSATISSSLLVFLSSSPFSPPTAVFRSASLCLIHHPSLSVSCSRCSSSKCCCSSLLWLWPLSCLQLWLSSMEVVRSKSSRLQLRLLECSLRNRQPADQHSRQPTV